MMKYLMIPLILALAACTVVEDLKQKYEDIRQQVDVIDQSASVSGKVVNRSGQNAPVYAALLQREASTIRWINEYQVSANGSFKFFAAPGTYTVAAFVDINNDGVYQPQEPATHQDDVRLIKKSAKQLPALVISGALDQKWSQIVHDTYKALKNIGRVAGLSDPMFSRENALLGMVQPLDFLERVGGGMFFLRKYRKGRIPVLFVHGINGTPAEFSHLIRSLDRKIFQPVVLHYPSGLPLDVISEYMLTAINKLQTNYRFAEFYIVAHSMGGLVTRSFVKKYETGENPARIGMVMTINSPMMGIESASTGVKYMPIVVPAWRDIASGSSFVKALHDWPWPREIPYHLVFSYLPDRSGDGVVPLTSQIPQSLQREAVGMYGFMAEHAGLLQEKEFTRLFNRILLENLTGVKTELAAGG